MDKFEITLESRIIRNSLLVFIVLHLLVACQEDEYVTESSLPLITSLDTLRFDTVFTEVGSATRSFKILNPNDEGIRIDRITLQKGNASMFRLNVDGISGREFSDVSIPKNDSIWVFAEVTVDPDDPVSVSPFVIEEMLEISNGSESIDVLMEAFGQNANYIPNRHNQNGIASLSCEGGTVAFDDPRPYVVYGILYIDDCNVEVPAGTRIHVHGGLQISDGTIFEEGQIYESGLIYINSNASLNCLGEPDKRVLFSTDRLEPEFQDQRNLWAGIQFAPASKNNTFNYTDIRNSIVGIQADSATNIRLEHVSIKHTSGPALFGFNSTIFARNSLLADNGTHALQVRNGGNYIFHHNTLANFGNQAPALTMNNFLSNSDGQILSTKLLNSTFINNIITGSNKDELAITDISQGEDPSLFRVNFRNCVVKEEELSTIGSFPDFYENCIDCINEADPRAMFAGVDEDDYHLDTTSVAIDKGLPLNVPFDLDHLPRDLDLPDIGCYEFQK